MKHLFPKDWLLILLLIAYSVSTYITVLEDGTPEEKDLAKALALSKRFFWRTMMENWECRDKESLLVLRTLATHPRGAAQFGFALDIRARSSLTAEEVYQQFDQIEQFKQFDQIEQQFKQFDQIELFNSELFKLFKQFNMFKQFKLFELIKLFEQFNIGLCAWVTHKLLLNFNAQEIRILSKTARLQIRPPQRVAPTHYPLSNAFPRSIVDLTSLEIAYETERSRVPNSVQNGASPNTSTTACCTDPLSTVQRISEECVEMEQIQFKNFEKQVKEHQKDLVVGPDHQQHQQQQNNSEEQVKKRER
uniref:Uncharacterized protein n=1 Tax=Globodera pallida TaxID=36090 RepID=A0A183CAS3_GLOPA